MAKVKRKVTSVSGVIKAYGGLQATAKAFHTTPAGIEQWRRWGEIPCTDYLGLYLGLKARGYVPGPKLFDVKSLDELPGI